MERIQSLDGLRAISIIIVTLSHIFSGYGFDDRLFIVGNFGVRIFFAISGFLITSILMSETEKNSGIDLKKFYFRRVLRIFPAYLFFLGFAYCFLHYNFLTVKSFLPALTFTTNYFFDVPHQIQHLWSLAVEEQFYLIFPVIMAFVGITKCRKFLLIILFITPFFRVISLFSFLVDINIDSYDLVWNFHTNMDVLATGCLLALYRDELHANIKYKKHLESNASFFAAIVIIVFVGYFSADYLHIFYLFGISIMNLLVVFCIDWLIVNRNSLAGKFVNLRPLTYIGVLSYSIYLWQQIFTFYEPDQPWTHFPYNIFLLSAFALFSYYFVEIKFLNLRKKLEKKFFAGKTANNILEPSVN